MIAGLSSLALLCGAGDENGRWGTASSDRWVFLRANCRSASALAIRGKKKKNNYGVGGMVVQKACGRSSYCKERDGVATDPEKEEKAGFAVTRGCCSMDERSQLN